MGGILLKQLLVNGKASFYKMPSWDSKYLNYSTASKSSDCELQNLVKNTKALLMLSVPHDGSSVATLNLPARFLLLPSVEVEELRKGKTKSYK